MKVNVKLVENLHFVGSARHFTNIHIDEPGSFKGSDKGPSSVEYLLMGIGGCLGSSLSFCLQKKSVKVDEMIINLDGKLKHTGPKMRLRLVKVDCNIFLSVKEGNQEDTEICEEQFREFCVITESIMKGIPITVNIKKKNNKIN
ncbi:MAG: hypothetical protein GF317_09420 [Candidatus Lokiarchaeota archaeon]|nr:hypothetical protein [Candidatus Lokiarchaeota archaeon]MBD3199931.1 hypothetical protein [Candidatus Lokiarchaeota archaeon]